MAARRIEGSFVPGFKTPSTSCTRKLSMIWRTTGIAESGSMRMRAISVHCTYTVYTLSSDFGAELTPRDTDKDMGARWRFFGRFHNAAIFLNDSVSTVEDFQ